MICCFCLFVRMIGNFNSNQFISTFSDTIILIKLATLALSSRAIIASSVQQHKMSLNGTSATMNGHQQEDRKSGGIRLFLCGDVMTGRGIDQILPFKSKPNLHESFVRDANEYVRLAERKSGKVPKILDYKTGYEYPWGDALDVLEQWKPHLRIINLETAVTTSEDNWPNKGINYRMHPGNVPMLSTARINCCVLANNHILDWGYEGLIETLAELDRADILTVGAERTMKGAEKPAIMELSRRRRVLVYAWCDESSGVPDAWAVTSLRGGVNFLNDGITTLSADLIANRVAQDRRQSGDIVIISIHWGGNWGYEISNDEQNFAHRLIDSGVVNVVYGHSSHHAKAIEVYKDKLILYGCGDFLNDYEGIVSHGHEEYRGELTLMYFPVVNSANGKLIRLKAVPMQIRKLSLIRASDEGAHWLHQTMARECAKFGVRVERDEETNVLTFLW